MKFFLIVLFFCMNVFSIECEKDGKCKTTQNEVSDFLSDSRNISSKNSEQQGIILTPQGISPVTTKSVKIAPANTSAGGAKESLTEKKEDLTINTQTTSDNSVAELNEKKAVENPAFMLVWLAIFAFLYYYLRERKKRKKRE